MKVFLILSFLISNLVMAQAYQSFTENLPKTAYQFRFEGSAHDTQSTFDKNGNQVALDEGEDYKIQDMDIYAAYGYSKELQFKFGTKFRKIDSVELGPSDSNLHPLSETGIQSGYVEVRYAWPKIDKVYYTFEFGYRHFSYTNKLFNNSKPNDFLVLGNDGQDFHLGFNITIQPNNSRHFITSKLFYQKPGSNMSSEFFYQLEGALVWNHIALFAGVVGVESLNDDDYTNDESNKPVLATGPSKNFNGINPNYTDVYGGAALAFNQSIRLEGKFGKTVGGVNTDERQFAVLSLVLSGNQKAAQQNHVDSFKDYSIEGEITKVSPNSTYVVINRGLADGVVKGMRFDIYQDDFLGGSKLVAAGLVTKLGASSCIVQIGRLYDIEKIREGLSARASQ